MKKTKEITLRKMKRKLWLLGIFKIPIIGFIKPELLFLNNEESRVRIKLRRRTKNHLNSMYFGGLTVGADIAAGLHVFYFSEVLGYKISFAFKGFNADFIKRAETDVIFKIDQGELIRKAITTSYETKGRVNQIVDVVAIDLNEDVVANFKLVVSVKVK